MSSRRISRLSPHPASGVALVIVLGLLVLIAVLVVAFFSSVSTELQSAKAYANQNDARLLADSAVNLVISQIQDATTTPNQAWASQPGMIRTYDDKGEAVTAFKLYSSGAMRVTGAFDPIASLTNEIQNDWFARTDLYADLNKPVITTSGTTAMKHYPIINPGAVADSQGSNTALDGASAPIEGCFINTAIPGVDSPNPIPMPVEWLYMLKDGTISAMDPATKKVAGAGVKLPDGTPNTIVGRVAFWTDDESSKVNINTASEGTFWDRPWTRSPYGTDLSRSMPMQNEFQRFPGHPAMTSLSVIFPPVSGESTTEYNERIYGIIPRVAGGGSMSGSIINTLTSSPPPFPIPDADRLFASVDEFLFDANASRAANLKGPSESFSEDDIEKTRFFLTANGRSPEVNLFNKPRISLWPLQIDPDPQNNSHTRTAKDKLIAFCSTVGNIPYYFQRYNTYSFEENLRPAATSNWTNKQNPIPSSQSATMDWDLIPRNKEIFDYLRTLTSRSIPGLGGRLSAKYPSTSDQILVEILDFIRSEVNPQRTLDNKANSGPDDIEYFYAPGYKRSNPSYLNVIGQQQVVPLLVKNAAPNSPIVGKGFGRFPSIKQAVLVFQASDPSELLTVSGTTTLDNDAMDMAPLKMRAVLLLDPFNVTPGLPTVCPNVRIKVRWVDADGVASPCKVNGTPLDFPDPAVNLITARDTELNLTALGGIEYPYKYYEKPDSSNPSTRSDLPKRLGVPVIGSDDEEQFYPFYTSEITVPGVSGPPPKLPARLPRPTFVFEGGELEIEIYPGYSKNLNPDDCVQTIRMAFPKNPVTLLRPRLDNSVVNGVRVARWADFNERLTAPGLEPAGSHNLKPLIRGAVGTSTYDTRDTVRSVEALPTGPAHGDLRVFANLREVPSSYFGVAIGYDDTKISTLHGLRIYPYNLNGNGTTLYNGFKKARLGSLISGVAYYDDAASEETFGNPIVPNDLVSATMKNGEPGDWDTGPGSHVDGPFINKPDMGNNGRFTNYFGLGNNATTFFPNENGSTYSPNRQISSAVAFGSLPTGINPNDPDDIAPWQTLLFSKHPAAGKDHPGFGKPLSGPPYDTPPDHAFLDFFTMPIVEPYAISEPFSTAGKVNMNYQIVPFTYLTRDTAVRAVFKSTLMMAIPTTDSLIYKQSTNTNDYRYTINMDEKTGTLKGFQDRFESGDIFRSASEICDISLVPKSQVGSQSPAPGNPSYDSMSAWWETYKLTGDNVREQPYGHVYPRLTTKSNTFTVHVTTQSLKKVLPPSTASGDARWGQWDESKDQVTGEFRGSFIVERYLDPNSDSLVKADGKTAANELDADAMVGPYKFRIISSKRFAP